jgi:glyceraldehyde-3-phosphate dehydrogenase (NADP+)
LRLVEILLECGLPPLGIACLAGGGAELGSLLAADARVRKISFTGSADVGRQLCAVAGLKRVTMELGSNSPLIVMPDADIERAATAIVATGYGNAGQVCISTQRVIAVGNSHGELIDALTPRVRDLRCGDPLAPETQMGPMIRERDAIRVADWIGEAVADGATLVCGGDREGTRLAPTLLDQVQPRMRICREELFGPAVGVARVESLDEAIALANDSRYGLSAGIFTRDLATAMRFAREVESGNLHINWGPGWRADLMPYGGLKDSGFGKEGPRYAIEEMTELKTVILHGG